MEDRIFFKHKTETLKGPFTELQVQDLYRKRSFDSSVLFYFTRSDDFSSDEENSGIRLDSLQYLNGFGCPFFKVDENETREFKEDKLARIKKEISEVQKECSAVFFMEKMIERMERELEELTVFAAQKETLYSEENESINLQEEESLEEVTEPDYKGEQKKRKKKRSKKSKKKSDEKEQEINEEKEEEMIGKEKGEEINEEFIEPILKIGSGKSTHPCYYMRLYDGTRIEPDMADKRRRFRKAGQFCEKHLANGRIDDAVRDISLAVLVAPNSAEVLNKYKQLLTSDVYARVIKLMTSLKVPEDASESFNSRKMREKEGTLEEQKKEVTNEENIEPVLKIGSGKSTHPCYYMRMFEGTGMGQPDMVDVRRCFAHSAKSAEKYLAAGDIEKAAVDIAMAVMVDKRSEEVLNKYKQRLSPEIYALVVSQMSSFKMAPMDLSSEEEDDDFAPPAKSGPSEISLYRKMRKELSEIKIDNHTADVEYTAHSSQLHQIFSNCGIYIPRSFQLSFMIIYAIEAEIDLTQLLLETIPSVNGMGIKQLQTIFEEGLPSKYFDLVRPKLPSIRKYLIEYILSTATDRRRAEEKEQKAEEDFTRKRNVLEKVFDTLPPEHFTFCLENVPSLKDSLEQYITYTVNVRKHIGIEVTKPSLCNSDSKQKMKEKKKKIERPDSIPDDAWKQFYDLGRNVSDFIVDAFSLFESGDFANWDKDRVKNIVSSIDKNNELVKRYRRNLVCEYVLIERMKEKEFFCCLICEETLFNWKQAMIHFASNLHKMNEKCDIHPSIIEGFRRVLNSVTELPAKLGLRDFQSYVELYTNGGIVDKDDSIPSTDFIEYLNDKYSSLTSIDVNTLTDEQRSAFFEAGTLIGKAKSEMGREAMDELHEHLGLGETYCRFCCCETGNREEFYAHLHSVIHVHNVYATMRETEDESFTRFCLLTLLVNAHCKEIV